MDPGSLIPPLAKGGFLSLVYKDLAQPGVRQVGKAIGAIIGLGNTVLLPLRLLNEVGRRAEEAAYSKIADRFAKIPEEEINSVPPEIGVPALEGLSRTQDSTLQDLYVELLASAAQEGEATDAHPSFVAVIAALSPDEAKFLPQLRGSREHPFITIKYQKSDDIAKRHVADFVFGEAFEVRSPGNMALYISNLAGLGLIEVSRQTYLANQDIYSDLFEYYKNELGVAETCQIDGFEWNLIFEKSLISVTEFGKKFIAACVPALPEK